MQSERSIKFYPAEDMRHPNPSQNRGLRSVIILFTLRGRMGAVTFELDRRWLPESARGEYEQFEPTTREIMIHSPLPRKGLSDTYGPCEAIKSDVCYFESLLTLHADRAFEKLVREGDAGVWDALEKHYIDAFGEESDKEEDDDRE